MVNRIPQAQTSRESILAQLQALKAKEMDVSLHESKSKDGRYRVEIEGLPLSVTDANDLDAALYLPCLWPHGGIPGMG